MNRHELEKKLIEDKVPLDMYKLNGGFPNESFCLYENRNKWEVYYSERGQKSGLMIFLSEEEACQYFDELIIKNK